MPLKSAKIFIMVLSLALFVACAETPKSPKLSAPPPQNLLGSTEELQLVTELSLDLARQHGTDRVLVVFEIDDTLLTQIDGRNEGPCSDASAMRPMQVDSAEQVQRIQNAGLKVIALTARKPDCRMQTLEELRSNDFSFSASAWPPIEGFVEPFTPEGANRPVIYQNGIFFTAGQDKGLMLNELLEKSGEPYPALLLVVDHKQSNLNAMMKQFSGSATKINAWLLKHKDVVEVASSD